jgi:hypothetical protein
MSRRSARLLDDRPVAVIDRLRGDTDVWRLALNSLTARVAVLDELGNIVAVTTPGRVLLGLRVAALVTSVQIT